MASTAASDGNRILYLYLLCVYVNCAVVATWLVSWKCSSGEDDGPCAQEN
jgi:hypothetical protein